VSYEVFLDVLFVRNLFMDYLLIRIVNRLMKRKVSVAAGLAGSALASLLVCFWLVLPVGGGAVRFLFQAAAAAVLVQAGCRPRGWAEFFRASLLLWGMSMAAAGVWQFFLPFFRGREEKLFLILGAAAVLLPFGGAGLYRKLRSRTAHTYEVTLWAGGKCKGTKGLYDTGNCLRDGGKPVSVVEEKLLRELLAGEEDLEKRHPHYIPFRTVGRSGGVLLVLTLDALTICGAQKEVTVKNPAVAVSREAFSGEFGIILNPGLID